MRQAQAVKTASKAAGGTPREFTTITVTDGIAMGHQGMKSSLVSREVIADSVELTMRGHCYDALVGLAGCDKSLPGMMMAMLRLNVPSVFIYGGSILPGRFSGRDVTVVDVFEGVGKHSAGKMSLEDLCTSWNSTPVRRPAPAAASSPPTPWPASSEAIGLALPGSAGAPAPYEIRDAYAEASGEAVMDLIEQQHPPARHLSPARPSRTPPSSWPRPAARPIGGLHLPAMAHECGIEFDLLDVAEIFKRTPYIADLKPGGRYVAKDMCEAGGMPMLMKALLDGGFLHGDCMTVTGKTIAENLKDVKWPDRPGRRLSREELPHADRRRRRPEGQSRARRRHREGRRHEGPASSPARRAASTARKPASRPSRRATTRTATSSSSATRAPRAAPACARCCRPPRRSTARASATRWR